MPAEIGERTPAFSLKNHGDQTVKLTDFTGRWLVMFFYPKDNTSG